MPFFRGAQPQVSGGCTLGLVRSEDEVPEGGARGPLSPEQGRLWRPTPDVSPTRPRRKLSGRNASLSSEVVSGR